MASQRRLPFCAPFCFAFKQIEPHYDAQPPHTFIASTLYKPPTVKEAFRATPLTEYFKWAPNSVQALPEADAPHIRTHSTSSLFWCPDRQSFLHVPYDCTRESVQDKARKNISHDWRRLKFSHDTIGDDQCLSIVGPEYGQDVLGAKGPDSWMPELLPYAYQYQGLEPEHHGRSLLAGDLSILLSLAALSTTPDSIPQTIEHSFRPNMNNTDWVRHYRASEERTPREHGIVMYILYDVREVDSRILHKWETGQYGAILT